MVSLLLARQSWEFYEPRSQQWLTAEVPGCVHLDLRRHGLIPDPFYGSNELDLQWIEREDWTYRTAFDLDDAFLAQETVELVADGLDTLATLTLNGQEVARTENMFVGYRFSVKDKLRPGRNELVVAFANPMDYIRARQRPDDLPEFNDPIGGCKHIRKQPCSFGWDWGPRFATSGIYRDIRLEAWSGRRLLNARVRQTHRAGGGPVTLHIAPDCRLARPAGCSGSDGNSSTPTFACRLLLDGKTVAQSSGTDLTVSQPRLWWPHGHGEQPLYDLEVDLLAGPGGAVVDTWKTRVGLRTVELDRHPDEFGESFRFVVNGRAIFAKGANWIPAHSFVSRLTRANYDELLTDATDVHMNMIRVWGGGIYESEDFYDLCDEKGILVWQDFMFSCAMYPANEVFLQLVRAEAEYQVARLASRACLALWCGNNEIEQMATDLAGNPRHAADYRKIFDELLPAVVAEHDGVTAYWPCSPHDPSGIEETARRQSGGVHVNNEGAGDSHFWDVWHARKPVKTYETKQFRFCSEFGMQSYSSPEVAATFCPPGELNVFSPAMENHQKNGAGNQIILDYVSRLYRMPFDYETLSYLSQLNQLWCLKVGIEHFRRSMPRTMGALYWQLNDCWPVFSWSSVEFGGKWKALHYGARRFFAPALVSAYIPGDETAGIGNRLKSTIHEVHLYTVYDGREPEVAADLRWELIRFSDGEWLEQGHRAVALRFNESVLQGRLDFAGAMAQHGAGNIYLHVSLVVGGETVSEDTVFLTAPRFLNLPCGPLTTDVRAVPDGSGEFEIEFCSAVFRHRVKFELGGLAYRASDNFFDLHPNQPRKVRVWLKQNADVPVPSAEELRAKLTLLSLADSY